MTSLNKDNKDKLKVVSNVIEPTFIPESTEHKRFRESVTELLQDTSNYSRLGVFVGETDDGSITVETNDPVMSDLALVITLLQSHLLETLRKQQLYGIEEGDANNDN